jgi:hypothetical protein
MKARAPNSIALENLRSVGVRLRPLDLQLGHPGFESGGFQAENCRRAACAAYSPASLLKHRENLVPFALLERRLRPIAGLGLGNLDLQHIAGCKNHSAFDDVAQFANVARPRVLLELPDGFRGNPLDLLAHPPGESLDERPNEQRDILTALS